MRKEMFSLEGKRAFITGAARGIGRGFAEALAEYGASVMIADILEEAAAQTAADIQKKYKVTAGAVRVDVTVEEEVDAATQQAVSLLGGLDIAINNAGIAQNVAAEEMDLEQWERMMRTNTTGVFLCCRAEAKKMLAQGSGSIINTASMSASIVNTPQKQAHYNASKAGVVMLTKSMAAEWAPRGVRVNCISPGYILTEMNKKEHVKKLHPVWTEKTPVGRLGTVEDLQGAAVYLASEASNFMTGHNLIIDGGYTLW
jgi:NAD(P)-dependent dehydrogenase (short-subunit alcohol dehydrogenase family)